MLRTCLTLWALCGAAVVLAEDGSAIKFPSPDKRFALRVTELKESEFAELKVELIEKASGKVLVDLTTAYGKHLSDTVLVWSADSKWAAFATRDEREGATNVYFWNGSAVEEVPLPVDLPGPDIKFRPKDQDGGVKAYGGEVKPLRWLKSGSLELSSDSMMMSRESGDTYLGVLVITISFDAKRHASVQKVGKTKTTVE